MSVNSGSPDFFAVIRFFAGIIGLVLIVAGACLLLSIGMMVYQVLQDPTHVPLVEYIIEKVQVGDDAIHGTIKSSDQIGKEIEYDLKWSEQVRLIVFLFLGAMISAVLARISSVLISSGTILVKLTERKYVPESKDSPVRDGVL